MTAEVNWGILGTGFAARNFAVGLRPLPDGILFAIGSRSMSTAAAFADEFGIPRRYGSYEDLVNDEAIDIVFVATPNHRHLQDCLLVLEAGKAVLCEKPFAINSEEAKTIVELAREKQLFCMEAMWTRFIPLVTKLPSILRNGAIGNPSVFQASLGFAAEFSPRSRFFNADLGGGVLLDLGVYLVSLSSYLFGQPIHVEASATLCATGVEDQCAAVLTYDTGKMAILMASFRANFPNDAIIGGSEGYIHISPPIYRPTRATINTGLGNGVIRTSLRRVRAMVSRIPIQADSSIMAAIGRLCGPRRAASQLHEGVAGNGYGYQAQEAMECLRSGEAESEKMPLNETIQVMTTLDAIRTQWQNTVSAGPRDEQPPSGAYPTR